MNHIRQTIAQLLAGLDRGDRDSIDELFGLIYDELKTLAHRQRRRWRGNLTLNTTALVHEVYVKLVAQQSIGADSSAHFRALASRAMRHVLCNYSRDREADKRGGSRAHRPLDDGDAELPAAGQSPPAGVEATLAALDHALRELEQSHPRAARVVECRFFGGLTVDETAAAIDASPRSVKRDWAMAQAWLHRRLGSEA